MLMLMLLLLLLSLSFGESRLMREFEVYNRNGYATTKQNGALPCNWYMVDI